MLTEQELDGDDLIEPRVARLPHFAHAARANGRDDFLEAEFFVDGEGHG